MSAWEKLEKLYDLYVRLGKIAGEIEQEVRGEFTRKKWISVIKEIRSSIADRIKDGLFTLYRTGRLQEVEESEAMRSKEAERDGKEAEEV